MTFFMLSSGTIESLRRIAGARTPNHLRITFGPCSPPRSPRPSRAQGEDEGFECTMVFVLLNDLVTTSKGVAEVSGRLEKIERLAGLLRRFAPDEVGIGVAFLSGRLT